MLALIAAPTASAAVVVEVVKCEKPPVVNYGPANLTPPANCPAIALDALVFAGPRSVTTTVATSRKVPVSVSGVASVPRIRKRAPRQIQLSASSQTVEPGRIGRFELAFPSSLYSALQALPPKRFLTLTVTVSATDEIDRVTTTSSVVQLKGQAKPKKRKKAGRSK
ncbi:MAG TPA: hypothetical protein VK889_02535 [Solirubrobacterales bacterium]|nr:hypothetical protein [Solirubrobacterales bacterium]